MRLAVAAEPRNIGHTLAHTWDRCRRSPVALAGVAGAAEMCGDAVGWWNLKSVGQKRRAVAVRGGDDVGAGGGNRMCASNRQGTSLDVWTTGLPTLVEGQWHSDGPVGDQKRPLAVPPDLEG